MESFHGSWSDGVHSDTRSETATVDMSSIDFGWDDVAQLSDVDTRTSGACSDEDTEEAEDTVVDADICDDGSVLLMVDEDEGDGSWQQVSPPLRAQQMLNRGGPQLDLRALDRPTKLGAKDTLWRTWRPMVVALVIEGCPPKLE